MSKITTVLFDFDGVIADTEKLYDIFWNGVADRRNFGVDNFASRIKGRTLPSIFDQYIPNASQEERNSILKECDEFEEVMDFEEVAGSLAFVAELKKRGYKVGMVTSSGDVKMARAFRKMNLAPLFDTLVTANRITQGKPHPMGYLLAAEDLGAKPEECVVFEDAFSGIQAGTAAGMRVIGLSTTNPKESLEDKVHGVIPNFIDIEGVISLLA